MARIRNATIGMKVLAIAVLACLGLLTIGGLTAVQMRQDRYADRKASTRAQVQTVMGVITSYGDLAAKGTMSQEEAQAAALAVIKSLRYNKDDYFWINTYDLKMVMHPTKPDLDGTDISGMKDPDGVQLFVRFVELVKADGAGFLAYQWPKPGKKDPQPKISYVAGYQPWQWVLGSGVYTDDVETAVQDDLRTLGLELLAVIAALLALVWGVMRSITRPLLAMTSLLDQGSLDQRLDERDRRTELDRLAAAVNGTLIRVENVVEGVTTAAETVSDHVSQLAENAEAIKVQARRTAEQACSGSAATHAAVTGYDQATQAVGEINDSIRVIAENVQQVSSVATDAVQATEESTQIVGRLGASSAEIGAVLQTISAIAEQTNLLALNATIESARAGDAGKGFAVVATEVKDLAQETAHATEDIARRIQALQADVTESVTAIARIAAVIEKINEHQSGIAAAVEEQSVTLSLVAKNVEDSSRAGADANSSISAVAQATTSSQQQLDHISEGIHALNQLSRDLETSVSVFRR
jgi:methyl-accepting chemotaxis protein